MKANPSNWSKESQQSYAADYTTEYKDKEYNCWRCQRKSVYTARDQKYTYEIHKAYFWQERILCQECWEQKNLIFKKIRKCEEDWAESKQNLRCDEEFLKNWLNLLIMSEEYVPYKPNTAIKNMLSKLLRKLPQNIAGACE